ncbi:InlB B-repeat-containing protein [Bacillus sp. FJAT-49732]|uniref:InlB B-repeat-containing protein n=1 Tax=Lederbergia citrisecunda TaxID=2833583 RepID=A0A942TMY2_9BACI|nr:InlB B-repeat-containing protein [Lederbergia citrisecunda]MBS4200530.1 InlB B-repeat-containing protein [Lederbergia citrisecunda]
MERFRVLWFIFVLVGAFLTAHLHVAKAVTEVPEGYIGIYTADDLDRVRENLSAKYILMNDIDLIEKYSTGWMPIGSEETAFTGVFDGNGKKISGLTIKQKATSIKNVSVGLFSHIQNGEIRNLSLSSVHITLEMVNNSDENNTLESNVFAGSLAGDIQNSTVINTSVNASISITANNNFVFYSINSNISVGGIVGKSFNTSFTDCKSSGEIKTNSINRSGNKAVTSRDAAGGIVGDATLTTFNNCENTATVGGDSFSSEKDATRYRGSAGGILGNGQQSSIVNSRNLGLVNGSSTSSDISMGIGGIIGRGSDMTIIHSVNEGTIKAKENFQYNYTSYSLGLNTGGIIGELQKGNVENSVNKGGINGGNTGGIAGLVNSGEFLNCQNEGQVMGENASAGIVASLNGSTISQSRNNGEISGGMAGGLAGDAYASTVTESSNEGTISGDWIGGIVGTIYGTVKYPASVSKSFNTSNLQGNKVGGVVGHLSYASITDSYNMGHIVASFMGGGIVGSSEGKTIITRTYNIGGISPDGTFSPSYSGAILGGSSDEWSAENRLIKASYYLDSAVNFDHNDQGKQGINKETFNEMKNILTYAGFDFESVWKLDKNSDYPFPQLIDNNAPTIEKNIGTLIKSGPVKTTYVKGEDLDLTGMVVSVRTSFGNELDVTVTEDMVRGYDREQSGKQLVTVTYDGFITTFDVYVKDKFKVVFKDTGGYELKTEYVPEGEAATAPEVPAIPGMTFIGWDKQFDQVTSDLYITALYEVNDQVVTFLDYDGNVLETKIVKYASTVDAPTAPAVPGYTFFGWEQSLSGIYSDLTVKPIYKRNQYKVYFIDDRGSVINLEDVYEGEAATAPEPPIKEGYMFTGWDNDFSHITSDMIVTAQFKQNEYKVIFMDGTKVLFEQNYKHKSKVLAPEDPVKPDYTFIGWYLDPKFEKLYEFTQGITEDLIVYAKFMKNTGTPQNVTVVSEGYDKLKIKWNKADEANGYEIYRATSSNGTYSLIGTITSGNTITYTNSNLTTGNTYFYKVRAYQVLDGKKVYSPFSAIASGKPILSKVGSVNAVSAGFDKIKTSWAKVAGASGFEVYRSNLKSGTCSLVATLTSGSSLTYTNGGLQTGTTYYYKVREYRVVNGKKVYSSYSDIISGKPILSKVTSVQAVSAGYDKIKTSWAKVTGASGYEVYRSNSKNGTYGRVATLTNGSSITYTNGSLQTGTTYYYKVRSYRTVNDKKIYGAFSSIVSTKPLLSKPLKVSAKKMTSTSVKISWSKVSGATGYEVYRSTSKNGKASKLGTLKTISFINKSLSKNKAYYYKVRAYRTVNGKKVYSSDSIVIAYKN